jgi:hypothetical protein
MTDTTTAPVKKTAKTPEILYRFHFSFRQGGQICTGDGDVGGCDADQAILNAKKGVANDMGIDDHETIHITKLTQKRVRKSAKTCT